MTTRILKNKFRRRGRIVMKDRATVYHVICRAALQSFLFNPEAKDMFRRMLYKQARFTGVEILSYCLMDNHVHLLIRVPPCPWQANGEHLLDDAEILRRYTAFYGEEQIPLSAYSVDELSALLATGGDDAETARRTVLARMGDLSAFMRELKQRFVIWYNARTGNVGTLWSARFRSLIVENTAEVLTRVAAYIDLNPIRAGVVEDPKDYPWTCYSAAIKGDSAAQNGICALFPSDRSEFEALFRSYRLILLGIGVARGKRKLSGSLMETEERIKPTKSAPSKNTLQARLGQFSRGLGLGGRAFIESLLRTGLPQETARQRKAREIDGDGPSAIFGTRN